MTMSPGQKPRMTEEHKAALAEGRKESRAVRQYLEALEVTRPRRGRRRTKESIEKRLAKIEMEIPTSSPLKRVQLIQERLDLTEELAGFENPVDPSDFEPGFTQYAKNYSQRKGISYAAWRELGVPAAVLQRAGISRSS